MEINLPPEVAEMLERKIETGEYHSASDAIAWALLALDDCETWEDQNTDIEELRRWVQEGIASGRSETTPEQLFAELRAESAARQSAATLLCHSERSRGI